MRLILVLLLLLIATAVPPAARPLRGDGREQTVSPAAGVTRLEILSREPMAGQSTGNAGPIEVLRGRVYGEVDPSDRRNRIIQDLDLAPRNARGRVEYVATFAIAKPVDLSKASGTLIYSVVNRGNGDVEASPEGHIYVVSGWQGDVVPTPRNQTIAVPIARARDGSTITGPVLQRFVNVAAGTTTMTLRAGSGYPHAASDQTSAVLTMSTGETVRGVKTGTSVVSRADWALADCRTAPFPGVPDPTRLCLRTGFAPDRLYEFVYNARDPLVLGVGLAATRDLVAFLRHAKQDAAGVANPVAGAIRHTVAIGNSQSGNFIRTFIHLGFNEDLSGRMVWDGVFPRIAARQTPMNFRFALPGGAVDLYEPGSEGVLWWSRYEDRTRRRGQAASLLDRCMATKTCPRVIEAFGSAEFWGLRMSPGLVGTDARQDVPLPPNVRRYYMPGTTHGGGRGGFQVSAGGAAGGCALPGNPNPMNEQIRALTAALVDWVSSDRPPPDSRYPMIARGDLVPATAAAMGFPKLPGVPSLDGLAKDLLDYDFGSGFRAQDVSGVITRMPPAIVQATPTPVPRVDADGNETSGVPSVLHQAPLGTYLGWNIARGFFAGQICGFQGGYVPFAVTRAERESSGDPRPSVEERYGTLEGYLCAVERAADRLVRDRFLLVDDRDRMLAEARASKVLPAAAASTEANRARADFVCTILPRS